MNNLDQNYYSRWLELNELTNIKEINVIGENDIVNTVGLPIGSIEDKIIVDTNIGNSLVIGATGSGKTQSILLPMLEQGLRSGESLFVNDSNGELYITTSKRFIDNGYNVININLDNTDISDSWNPFTLMSKLYKENKQDDAYKLLNESLSYLISEDRPNADPFWTNTASQYLTGIILSLFEKNIDISKINFESISKFTTEYNSEEVIEYIEELDKEGIAYKNISPTYLAPSETKASIMSVLNQKLTSLLGRNKIVSRLSTDSFDISNIRNNKTIIYFTYDDSNIIDCSLYNIFIEQIIYVLNNDNNKKPYTLLLDDFDSNSKQINRLNNKINNLRRVYGQTVLFVSGLDMLTKIYGETNVEVLKYQVTNILYLISNEYTTLKFISDFCGKKSNEENLVSPEGLRRIPMFSSLYMKLRTMPYYGTLMPYYKMNIQSELNNPTNKEYNKIELFDITNL